MTTKQFDNASKEYSQQFSDQIKALDAKLQMDTNILSHIHDIYKRRAIIEEQYSDQLFKLAATVSQKVKNEEMRRSKWKNYSPQTVLTCVLASMQHSARGHKKLSEILKNQMTQRIADIQEDIARLTKRTSDILVSHQTGLNASLSNLNKKHKEYIRAYTEAEEERKKASKALENLDKEVVRLQDKKKVLEKSKQIKKWKDEFLEKEKIYVDKQAECIIARNKYLINVKSLNATLKHYFNNNLEAILQTRDFGLHNNLTRLCMNQASFETSLQSMHETINAMFEGTIEKIDAVSDLKVFKSLYSSALDLNSPISYYLAKNDQCFEILKDGNKVDEILDEMYKSISVNFEDFKTKAAVKKQEIEILSKQLQNIIDQKDYDVAEFFLTSSAIESSMTLSSNSKTNSLSRVRTGSQDGSMGSLSPTSDQANSSSGLQLYSTLQKSIKNDRIGLENKYLSAMENYLSTEMKVVNQSVKIQCVNSARCPNYLTSTSNREHADIWSCHPSFLNSPSSETPQDDGGIQIQTALLIGKREKLFGGDLKKYSEDLKELVPIVVKSCIRLISEHGMSTVGVFRVPGSQNDVVSYSEKFAMGQNPLIDLKGNNNDVNLAASILKSYFRELDPPIFDSDMFYKCVDNYDRIKTDQDKMISFLRDLVSDAHPAVYATTKYLLSFLNHMIEFSSKNCMDMMNVAIIFGPCLIPIPNDSATQQFQYQGIINQLTQCLIRNHLTIYNRTLPIGCDTLKYEYCRDFAPSSPDTKAIADNQNEDSQKLRRNESTHNMPSRTIDNDKGKARHVSDSEAAAGSERSSLAGSTQDSQYQPPSSPVLFEAIAIAEYLPRTHTELSLSNGTRVFITQKMTDQWLYGYTVNSGGVKSPAGRVPVTYVREVAKEIALPGSAGDTKLSVGSVMTDGDDDGDGDKLESLSGREGDDNRQSVGVLSTVRQSTSESGPADEEWQQALGTLHQLDQINIRKNRSTFNRSKNELTMSKFVAPLPLNPHDDIDCQLQGDQTTIQEFLLAESDRELKAKSLTLDKPDNHIRSLAAKDHVTNTLSSDEKVKSSSMEFRIKKPSKLISEIAGQFEMSSSSRSALASAHSGSNKTLNIPAPAPPPTLPKPRKIPPINK